MTNEEKAIDIALENAVEYHTIDDNGTEHLTHCYQECKKSALEMAAWKDAQLDKAFDKALEHHQNKLTEGKITQYGMDNVFAFVQNVRYLLAHDC